MLLDYAEMIENMWFSVFGNSLIGCVVFLIFLFFMCAVRRFDLGASVIVVLPTLFGMVASDLLPLWIKALFVMPIGVLWIRALMRIVGLG